MQRFFSKVNRKSQLWNPLRTVQMDSFWRFLKLSEEFRTHNLKAAGKEIGRMKNDQARKCTSKEVMDHFWRLSHLEIFILISDKQKMTPSCPVRLHWKCSISKITIFNLHAQLRLVAVDSWISFTRLLQQLQNCVWATCKLRPPVRSSKKAIFWAP